jgi:hypothetical protein
VEHFQPNGRHTVTPRIITPQPEEMVHFVKEVFRGQGEFHVNRPAEIRIGDSLIMISDGGGLREPVSAFLYVYVEMWMKLTSERSKREQKHLSFHQISRMAIEGRWSRTHGATCGRLLRASTASRHRVVSVRIKGYAEVIELLPARRQSGSSFWPKISRRDCC